MFVEFLFSFFSVISSFRFPPCLRVSPTNWIGGSNGRFFSSWCWLPFLFPAFGSCLIGGFVFVQIPACFLQFIGPAIQGNKSRIFVVFFFAIECYNFIELLGLVGKASASTFETMEVVVYVRGLRDTGSVNTTLARCSVFQWALTAWESVGVASF